MGRFGRKHASPQSTENRDLARAGAVVFMRKLAAVVFNILFSVYPLRGHLPGAAERPFIVSRVPGTPPSRKQKVGLEPGSIVLVLHGRRNPGLAGQHRTL